MYKDIKFCSIKDYHLIALPYFYDELNVVHNLYQDDECQIS